MLYVRIKRKIESLLQYSRMIVLWDTLILHTLTVLIYFKQMHILAVKLNKIINSYKSSAVKVKTAHFIFEKAVLLNTEVNLLTII